MGILILFAACLAGGFIFPWWFPAMAAYAVGFWKPRGSGSAFLTGFSGAGLAWLAAAGFLDWRNHSLLSGRIADLFHLPGSYSVLAVTGLVGGLMGGMSAWAGFGLRAYANPRPSPDAGAVAAARAGGTGEPAGDAGDRSGSAPDPTPSA